MAFTQLNTSRERQPCSHCGGPKEPGRRRRLCDACRAMSPIDLAGLSESGASPRERRVAWTKAWRQRNPDKIGARGRMKPRTPEQNRAHVKLHRAIRLGRLIRPSNCEECGQDPGKCKNGASKIQAHHEDYSRPLDVQWLCPKCHSERLPAVRRFRSETSSPRSIDQ
jgi:hypothetical protein